MVSLKKRGFCRRSDLFILDIMRTALLPQSCQTYFSHLYKVNKVLLNYFIINNCTFFQIVDVAQSSVSMLPTKTEIKLRKLEPGSWSNLDFPRVQETVEEAKQIPTPKSSKDTESSLASKVDAVDLSDL